MVKGRRKCYDSDFCEILIGYDVCCFFLSGMFPALFGGKEYIDPYGEDVHIGDFYYFYQPRIFNDYETLREVRGIGCVVYGLPEEYEREYFENNALVIFSVEMPHDDYRIWVKSVAEVGDTLEVEYSIITDGRMHAMLYERYTSEVIIETSKNIKNVELKESENIIPFDIEYIDQDPLMLFRDGTYV